MTMQYIHLDSLGSPCQVRWSFNLRPLSAVRDEVARVLESVNVALLGARQLDDSSRELPHLHLQTYEQLSFIDQIRLRISVLVFGVERHLICMTPLRESVRWFLEPSLGPLRQL